MSLSRALRWLAILIGIWALVFASRAAIDVTHGLRAEYFTSLDRSGPAAVTRIDPDLSAAVMADAWVGDPPPAFSARWFGYLMIGRAGEYTLGTRSDDGSQLTVDGRLLVDNGGHHPPQTRSASIDLDRGPHAVLVEYNQDVADFEIGLLWGSSERD